jgi:4-amino-4-deoxy-L-arabinose transferase-like glycosyltransferase
VICRVDQTLHSPAALVGILIVAQIVAWTLAPALVHSSPPLDVVEGYMWGREWVIATYKHPALPSWALEASRMVTGAVGWPAYVVSQLFVAATFVFVFLLGRDVMGPRRAAAGTLLLTGVAYYAWPTPEFNHNVAELPFWAGLPWALWRAVERRGILWWALAGALAAGGLYAKLTTALLLVTLAGWIVWDQHARRSLAAPGPWTGLAIFVVLVAPLMLWLVAHDFAPLRYAAVRSERMRGDGPHMFVLSLLLNLAGMVAMLWIAGLIGPSRRSGEAAALAEPPIQPIDPRALHYLIWVTVGPLALALASALLSGSNLRSAWGSSMFNLAGLLAVALTTARFNERALRRIAICAGALLIIVPIGYALALAIGPSRAGAPVRVSWPQAAIAERFAAIWAREIGRPLHIISGDSWIAGLVGVSAKDVPSIFTWGDPARSPWITPERLEREGMLIVWDARTRNIPEPLQAVVAAAPAREERFRWRWSDKKGDLAIGYAIVPPKPLAR